MTRFQVIYEDGSYTVYGTENYRTFPSFCEAFFKYACAFPYEVAQIRKLSGMQTPTRDIEKFDELIETLSKAGGKQ